MLSACIQRICRSQIEQLTALGIKLRQGVELMSAAQFLGARGSYAIHAHCGVLLPIVCGIDQRKAIVAERILIHLLDGICPCIGKMIDQQRLGTFGLLVDACGISRDIGYSLIALCPYAVGRHKRNLGGLEIRQTHDGQAILRHIVGFLLVDTSLTGISKVWLDEAHGILLVGQQCGIVASGYLQLLSVFHSMDGQHTISLLGVGLYHHEIALVGNLATLHVLPTIIHTMVERAFLCEAHCTEQ